MEYSLILALTSLVAMSALEELGIHVKGSIATADCAMIWAQHNTSGGSSNSASVTEINNAWTEINAMLNTTFNANKSSEVKMKNKILASQLLIKNKFLGISSN